MVTVGLGKTREGVGGSKKEKSEEKAKKRVAVGSGITYAGFFLFPFHGSNTVQDT